MLAFETERLTMRPWQMSDIDAFFQLEQNPNVGPNAGWKPVTDRGDSLQILQKFSAQPDELCAITLKETGRAIGSLGLHMDEKRDASMQTVTRTIGYVLDEPYWGHGYMTEAVRGALRFAFDKIGLELISVCHFPWNERSRRVIEKCGFHYEGTIRRACVRYDGAVLDDMIYSMTRDEFYAIYGL